MKNTTQLELQTLLHDVENADDACVARLSELLAAKRAIEASHVIVTEKPGRLCIHFDSRELTVGEVREFARRAGAALDDRYGHMLLVTPRMSARKARRLSSYLEGHDGVLEAVVSPSGAVRVEFDRRTSQEPELRASLAKALGPGTEAISTVPALRPADEHKHGLLGERAELAAAALCGIALLAGWLLPAVSTIPSAASTALLATAFAFGAFFTIRDAISNLRHGRFEIDFLMIVAATGAGILGEWAEGALLLFLFSVGHALERYAMARARRAIEALSDLTPAVARVRRDGVEEEISVDTLQVGDIVVVKPNERLPADGFVVLGESSVDQAPITGESAPVEKQPVEDVRIAANRIDDIGSESRVFAGTINGPGAIEVQVTRASADSTLSRVVQMVGEAETNRSPTQNWTDRFERIFVPAVLAGATLTTFSWTIIDEPFSASFYRAMALLVAASPCALAIATPSAILSGVARGARGGVLIKGGAPLEHLGRLEAIAFDKTGTVTEGRPRLVDIVPAFGATERELLDVAIAVERLSDHPLAAAVVRDGTERLGDNATLVASSLQSFAGLGVQALVGSTSVLIGKDDLFDEFDGPPVPASMSERIEDLESAGRTTMIVRMDDRYLGVIGLMDTPRPAARSVVARLRELGIRRMLMLSGDNQRVANTVAKDVGLDEAFGDLMPADKVEAINELRSNVPVAMVGDGVNDAPAMANATVGIAMGAAGSDVALETADVALMADDLSKLPFVIGLSRATGRIVRQNLYVSLGVVALLVPATMAGLGIGQAVVLHEGSTLVVVLNALRLLRFRSDG